MLQSLIHLEVVHQKEKLEIKSPNMHLQQKVIRHENNLPCLIDCQGERHERQND